MLGEVGEILVADVVARDSDLEAGAAVRALDDPVDLLDVARVADVERNQRREPVGRDERSVSGGVEQPRVEDLARCAALPRKLGDEGAKLRVRNSVARRADDDDVVEVAGRIEGERACFETLGSPELRVTRRAAVGGQVAWEEERNAGECEQDGHDPGSDRAPRMAAARPGETLGHGFEFGRSAGAAQLLVQGHERQLERLDGVVVRDDIVAVLEHRQ